MIGLQAILLKNREMKRLNFSTSSLFTPLENCSAYMLIQTLVIIFFMRMGQSLLLILLYQTFIRYIYGCFSALIDGLYGR